jgi:hypothetical protein
MSRPLCCPQCQKEGMLRSRRQSALEHVAAMFLMVPFHCQHCTHRVLAWRLPSHHPSRLMDRREHLRIPVRLCLSFSGGKVRGDGTVLDLSMGGCVIRSDAQVHVDDIFYLEIAITDQEPPIEVAAMVRSISARGIAFKFLRKAEENKRLRAFIQSSSGYTTSVLAKAT